jgi:hypothetical protein
MKTLRQIREASGGKEAYQKYFTSLLTKFGVDSPSELKGDKKNKFFSALDKGWEGSAEKNEVTIHISNELTEKLKAGKGKDSVGTDVDWDNVGDEKKWIKQAKSKYKVTIKKDVGKYHSGASISGKKADIIKFLQGPMYGGVDDRDIEDMWPDLLEAFSFFKKKKKGAKVNVKPGRGNAKMDIDKDAMDNVKKGADKKHGITMRPRGDEVILSGPKDKLLSFVTQELGWDKDDVESMWPDLLENSDDFKDDTDVDDDEGNYSGVDEKAPPGMEALVKKLKASGNSDEEAFAIAWGAYNDKERKKGRHGLKSMEGVEEGTWHLPSDKGVAAKFKKAMSKPITLGKNGEDAIDSIEKFIGDDSLFDDLNDAGKKNPKGDARKIIIKHMKTLNINPKTFHWAGQESVEEMNFNRMLGLKGASKRSRPSGKKSKKSKLKVSDRNAVHKIAKKHKGNLFGAAYDDIEKMGLATAMNRIDPAVVDIFKHYADKDK